MRNAVRAWQQAIAAIRDPFTCEVEVREHGQLVRIGHMHQIGFRDSRNLGCSTMDNVDRIAVVYGQASEVTIKLDDTALPRIEGSQIIYEDERLQFVLRPEVNEQRIAL